MNVEIGNEAVQCAVSFRGVFVTNFRHSVFAVYLIAIYLPPMKKISFPIVFCKLILYVLMQLYVYSLLNSNM
jgi:hypothetical protein